MLTTPSFFLAALLLSLLHLCSVQGSCIGGGELSFEDDCNDAGYIYCSLTNTCYSTVQSAVSSATEANTACEGLTIGGVSGMLLADLNPRNTQHSDQCLIQVAGDVDTNTYLWYGYESGATPPCILAYTRGYIYASSTKCNIEDKDYQYYCEFREFE